MQCFQCGTANAPGATACGRCGAALPPEPPPSGVNPYAAPYPANAYPPPGSYGPPNNDDALKLVVPIGVSPWALAAGYLGLISPICLGFTGPIAIICGIVALNQMKKNPQMGGKVRVAVGMAFGLLGSLMLVGFLISLAVNLSR